MNLDPTQPNPPDDTTTPSLDVDQAGSETRQGLHQDAQGEPAPRRLTLDVLQELSKWAKRLKAR